MALSPNVHPVLLHDEDYAPIDSVTVLGVVRLAVHAIVGAGGVFDETADDNSVAQGDTLCEILNLSYINNGTVWLRAQGGADNAPAGTANQGAFAAGIVTDPLDTLIDGDVSLLHMDTNGRLLVNMEGVVDDDDNSIAQAQTTSLILNLPYLHNGTAWIRAQGGTDNVAGMGLILQGAAVGGIVTDPLDAFVDGDFSILHFDTTGRLLCNADGVEDTDDNDIAASQVTALGISENYGYDGTVWRRLRVKAASAATSDETVSHLSVMAVLSMIDTSAPVGSQEIPVAANRNVGTAMSETAYFLPTRSAITGIDASAGAGSQNVPIAARNMDAVTDVAAALVGLVTNSRLAAFNYDTGVFSILTASVPADLVGDTLLHDAALNANSLLYGSDSTIAAVYAAIEARNFDAVTDAGKNLIGVVTNSRLGLYDPAATDWMWATGILKASAAALEVERQRGAIVYQGASAEYSAAQRGRRFYATHQTPGTLVTGETAFDATKPILMYWNNSANIRAILKSLNLSLGNTPGGLAYVTVAIDTVDRWSAGGTAIALQNSNEESAQASLAIFYSGPTATAAGAGTRYLGTWIMPAVPGANLDLDFEDGVLLGTTAATILVYAWAGTTAPQVSFVMDLEEVA